MNIIANKCLNGFHRRFIEGDSKPELNKLSAFVNMMQDDYSGVNLISKIIITDLHWDKMLNTKGFGRGIKYDKAQAYRKELTKVWNTINGIFEAKNEVEISKLMGLFLWDIEEDEFTHSYFGVIEKAIRQNRLWKNPVASDIFCSYYGFVQGEHKTLEQIANEYNLDRERVRQLKEEYLDSFNQDFWFIKDDLIKEKIKKLFNLEILNLEQINEQTEQANEVENIHFTREFYTYILSLAFDLVLVGNINDIKNKNERSSKGNIWNNLYLQTQKEKERCDLESLINALAIEMHKHHYYFEQDKVIDLYPYTTVTLSNNEIEHYNLIISTELDCRTELSSVNAIIKRNSLITQPEIVEAALLELGGFAYADDILEKVIDIYPEKKWTMPILRTSFRGINFYSVGKSGLFGLINVKDLRNEMGNGTLNEIIHNYMLREDSPVHIYELLVYINNLFPRPKSLNAIHAILEQNSKNYFKKFEGGYYGFTGKNYRNTKFPRIVGGHGMYLSQIIKGSNGLSLEEIFKILNYRYGLLEIQIRYLLYQMIRTQKISLIDGLYHRYFSPEITKTDVQENVEVFTEEIDVEIDQEELNFEELNQPDISNELVEDSLAQIKIRRGQPSFRQKLLKLYNSTCIVTGCRIPELLEAAHVLPYSKKKNYSLSNGLLLRTDIHTLFDLGMIAVDPENMLLKLSVALISSEDYKNLNNMDIGSKLTKLHSNYKISEEGLRWRWETFIELE